MTLILAFSVSLLILFAPSAAARNTSSIVAPVPVAAPLSSYYSIIGPWLSSSAYCWSTGSSHATKTATPASTNAHGTTTTVIGQSTVVYPTGYTQYEPSFSFQALLPTFFSKASCCGWQYISAATPSGYFLPPAAMTVNPQDPRGLAYTLTDCAYSPPQTLEYGFLGMSFTYGTHTITSYTGCSYTMCTEEPGGFGGLQITPKFEGHIQASPMTALSSLSTIIPTPAANVRPLPLIVSPTPSSQPTVEHTTPAQPSSTTHSVLVPGPPQGTVISPETTQTSQQSAVMSPETPQVSQQNALSNTQRLVTQASQGLLTTTPAMLPGPTAPADAPLPPITLGSTVITASNSEYIIGSQTLFPGSTIVVSGTTIQLAATPTEVIIGSSTAVVTTQDAGSYVWSGVTSSPSTAAHDSSTSSPALWQGDARRTLPDIATLLAAVLLSML